jgi:hypothetical protein
MKEMDWLEQEMSEWKPRRPPERLGRWLFGRAELPGADVGGRRAIRGIARGGWIGARGGHELEPELIKNES